MCSHKSSEGIAVFTSIALEAITQAGVVITFPTAAALVAVVDGVLIRRNVGERIIAVHSFKTKTSDSRSATRRAFIVLNNKPVLGSLDSLSVESHTHLNAFTGTTSGYLAVIDNLVGQVEKGKSDVIREIGQAISRVVKHNGVSSKSLIESGNEGQGKSLAGQRRHEAVLGLENQLLNLVLLRHKQVLAISKGVSSVRAESLGAVNVSVLSIADAATGLGFVPPVVVQSLGIASEVLLVIVSVDSHEFHILDVLAGTMTRAQVRAGGSVASFTFVALEALAKTSATVADAAASALSITVELARLVGGVHPCKFKRANAVRAIPRLHRDTYAPVIVAVAHIVHGAQPVATAAIVAVGTNGSREGNHCKNSFDHCQVLVKVLITLLLVVR
jgi:hypothetical protein